MVERNLRNKLYNDDPNDEKKNYDSNALSKYSWDSVICYSSATSTLYPN